MLLVNELHSLRVGWRNLPTLRVGTKTNTEISFSFWLRLFYSIPLLALTDRQTDWLTDGETNTLASRGLEELFFQLCCCVSFWFWREIGFGFTYYYVLGVPYSCGVVLVFLLSVWRVHDHYYDRKKRYSRLSGGCAIMSVFLVAIVIFVLVQLELNLIQIR